MSKEAFSADSLPEPFRTSLKAAESALMPGKEIAGFILEDAFGTKLTELWTDENAEGKRRAADFFEAMMSCAPASIKERRTPLIWKFRPGATVIDDAVARFGNTGVGLTQGALARAMAPEEVIDKDAYMSRMKKRPEKFNSAQVKKLIWALSKVIGSDEGKSDYEALTEAHGFVVSYLDKGGEEAVSWNVEQAVIRLALLLALSMALSLEGVNAVLCACIGAADRELTNHPETREALEKIKTLIWTS